MSFIFHCIFSFLVICLCYHALCMLIWLINKFWLINQLIYHKRSIFFGLLSGIRVDTLWLWFNLCCVDPLTPVVIAVTGLKRSLFSNTSYFSNLYLVECLRRYKSKSYLNSLMMTIEKDLSLTKKKLDCLRMKMCKGVCLRRVKVKSLVHNRQMRENTIPIDLSSKHKMCFMMKFAFKVMDICLWYLDSGCSRHMTGDRSLFKVFESKKGGNVTFGNGSKS